MSDTSIIEADGDGSAIREYDFGGDPAEKATPAPTKKVSKAAKAKKTVAPKKGKAAKKTTKRASKKPATGANDEGIIPSLKLKGDDAPGAGTLRELQLPQGKDKEEEGDPEYESDTDIVIPDENEDTDEDDQIVGKDEVDEDGLSEEVFDDAMAAGLEYSDVEGKTDEEVTLMIKAAVADNADSNKETSPEPEVKTVAEEVDGDPSSSDNPFDNLLFEEGQWSDELKGKMDSFKSAVDILRDEVVALREERDMEKSRVFVEKFTKDTDVLFNALESDKFGQGTYADREETLSKAQIRIRKAVGRKTMELLRKVEDFSLEDAFSVAVHKVAGVVQPASKPAKKKKKSARQRRLSKPGSRGRTKEPSEMTDKERYEATERAQKAFFIEEDVDSI